MAFFRKLLKKAMLCVASQPKLKKALVKFIIFLGLYEPLIKAYYRIIRHSSFSPKALPNLDERGQDWYNRLTLGLEEKYPQFKCKK